MAKHTRIAKVILVAIGLTLLVAAHQNSASIEGWIRPALATSVQDKAYFYRLRASYLHHNEQIDLNIVVGCAVRVTRYGDGDSSYDAFRDPTAYAVATRDGEALLQMIPDACRGETTENGLVPDDFLPGAILFDRKDDLSFGIGYLSEDAFANPKSQLKFLGASITKASRQEWEDFQPTARQNLVNPRVFVEGRLAPPDAEIRAKLWDHKALTDWGLGDTACHGVERFEISEPSRRQALEALWPSSSQEFWAPSNEQWVQVDKALSLSKGKMISEGVELRHIALGPSGRGFPTKTGGGALYGHRPGSAVAPHIYPLKADDGVPWSNAHLASPASPIFRDVELAGGANLGLTYCYVSFWKLGKIREVHIPRYFKRKFVTRIDGVPVQDDRPPNVIVPSLPVTILERAGYVYRPFAIGLY